MLWGIEPRMESCGSEVVDFIKAKQEVSIEAFLLLDILDWPHH
jgi:hypothetical protein